MSDLDNQHNNGPYQDQIFDNSSALCLALWAKIRFGWGWKVGGGGREGGGGETNVPSGLFMKGVGLYPSSSSFCPRCFLRVRSFCFCLMSSDVKIILGTICLRSFGSKYNTSTYLLA